MDPAGKVALVTGGASGIGLACVTELLSNGTKVAICDVDVKTGQEVVASLSKKYGVNKVIFIETNVTNPSSFEVAVKKTIDTFKGLDIFVNNAGIGDFERWELEISINLTAVTRGTILGLDYMGKDKGGKGGVVVNMASIAGLLAIAGEPVYTATKHGVVGLSRAFGLPFHFDRTGVRVLALCPGVTDTPLVRHVQATATDEMKKYLCKELGDLPLQTSEDVGIALLHVVRHGTSGSVWVTEGAEPVYEVIIPERQAMKANK